MSGQWKPHHLIMCLVNLVWSLPVLGETRSVKGQSFVLHVCAMLQHEPEHTSITIRVSMTTHTRRQDRSLCLIQYIQNTLCVLNEIMIIQTKLKCLVNKWTSNCYSYVSFYLNSPLPYSEMRHLDTMIPRGRRTKVFGCGTNHCFSSSVFSKLSEMKNWPMQAPTYRYDLHSCYIAVASTVWHR